MKRSFKRASVILLCMAMILSAVPAAWAEARSMDPADDDIRLEEGTYAPGEVIVLFRDGAVDEEDLSLRKARAMSEVGSGFGMTLNASGDADEAADLAKSEADILSDSLGDDFVLEDTIIFPSAEEVKGASEDSGSGDDKGAGGFSLDSEDSSAEAGELKIALVSSDKYDTKTLIEKLQKNRNIAAAEPNYYIDYSSYEDYELNDTYASYLYQANSPLAKNTAGDSVDDRGEMPEKKEDSVSDNASYGWKKLTGDEKETVVAVVDTGINVDHEDLKNKLWVNDPEKTGLKGEHGYNFGDNDTDLTDNNGHGTHCAGIIAAEANNGLGTAGITGEANVKIMMCKTDSDSENGTKLFTAMGSFNYVLRARKAGVNVVATSNSWGRDDTESTVFNEIVDRMGEAGILTFTAAGNAAKDLDKSVDNPASNESEFGITIGCAGITGEPAGFSNYGKSQVDIFAPGMNILSTVGVTTYFPSLYGADELSRTTAYYGGFDKTTELNEDGSVTPGKGAGDDSVKAFGASVFRVQKNEDIDDDDDDDDDEYPADGQESEGPEVKEDGTTDGQSGEEEEDPEETDEEQGGSGEAESGASCELKIVPAHYFTMGENAASLKVTVKNAVLGESYYLYFPYEKDPLTEGASNTRFSVYYESGENTDANECTVFGGEVVENEDGTVEMTGYGEHGHSLNSANKYVGTHLSTPDDPGEADEKILPYDDLDGRRVGIGVMIEPSQETAGEAAWKDGEPHDVTLYLDSIAVSKPDVEIYRDSSYEMMSGTSMACPSAAGACGLIAALYPREEGQDGAEYSRMIKEKLLSCAHKTDAFKDLCATGGFIDLSLLDDDNPVIDDAVCNVDKYTITLYGRGLKEGAKISYRRLGQKDASAVELPAGDMTVEFSDDGKEAVIKNAEALIGTYTEFTVADGDKSGKYSFFLVKGQKKLELVASHLDPNPDESDYDKRTESSRYIMTDVDGKCLYGIEKAYGTISRFDGDQFVDIPGTYIKDDIEQRLLENGNDQYQVINDYEIFITGDERPLVSGNKAYMFVSVSYTPGSIAGTEEDEETIEESFLASIDFTAEKPKWQYVDFKEPEFEGYGQYITVGNTLYAFAAADGDDCSLLMSYDLSDPEGSVWKREQDLPAYIGSASLASYKGKLYAFFGVKAGEEGEYGDALLSDDVWCFDGREWKKTGTLAFAGKYTSRYLRKPEFLRFPVEVGNGLVFVDTSVDGCGSTFLYDPETDKKTPMYYTINDSNSNDVLFGSSSIAVTRDGIYYMRDHGDEMRRGWGIYRIPESDGSYVSPYPVEKSANPLKVSVKNKTAKYSTLKKKAVTIKAVTVKKAEGEVTYKKVSVNKNAKKFTVNKKTGKITLKKGLKKGTYKVKIRVTAAGNDMYEAGTGTVTVKIKVK